MPLVESIAKHLQPATRSNDTIILQTLGHWLVHFEGDILQIQFNIHFFSQIASFDLPVVHAGLMLYGSTLFAVGKGWASQYCLNSQRWSSMLPTNVIEDDFAIVPLSA